MTGGPHTEDHSAFYTSGGGTTPTYLSGLVHQLEIAHQRLHKILELHVRYTDDVTFDDGQTVRLDECHECGDDEYPCHTRRIASGEEDE